MIYLGAQGGSLRSPPCLYLLITCTYIAHTLTHPPSYTLAHEYTTLGTNTHTHTHEHTRTHVLTLSPHTHVHTCMYAHTLSHPHTHPSPPPPPPPPPHTPSPHMQDRGPGMKWYGGLFIGSLWLLMLTTVVVSGIGLLEWLDALYIISYVKIATITSQYAPQVCRLYLQTLTDSYVWLLHVL